MDRLGLVAFQDQPRHRRSGSLIQAGEDVAVGVHRDSDGRVPEPFTDHLGRDAGGERSRRVAVAQVVQTDAGSPVARTCCLNQPENRWGWIGEPSGWVKTSPESS